MECPASLRAIRCAHEQILVREISFGRTIELTHAGPEDAAREAEPRKLLGQADRTPSGIVCSDLGIVVNLILNNPANP
jgi:hypothetical protein